MDNGACLQLLFYYRGVAPYTPPKVSKKAFAEFKKSKNVKVHKNHNFGDEVTLWVYFGEKNN